MGTVPKGVPHWRQNFMFSALSAWQRMQILLEGVADWMELGNPPEAWWVPPAPTGTGTAPLVSSWVPQFKQKVAPGEPW